MLRRIAIMSVILCLSLFAKAQDDAEDEEFDVVDSLLREYADATSDTTRMRLCSEIGYESNDPDTVIKYSSIGVSLFDGKDSSRLAELYSLCGWGFGKKTQYELAIEYSKKSAEIFKSIGDIQSYVARSVNVSIYYQFVHNYQNMWRTLFDALQVAQQYADTVNMCYCYYNIADVYYDLGMKTQGIEVASNGFQLAQQSKNYTDMGLLSSLLALLNESESDVNDCRVSINWAYCALKYFDKAGDLDDFYSNTKVNSYMQLVDGYFVLAVLEGNDSFMDSTAHYNYELELLANNDDEYVQVLVMRNKAKIKYAKHDYRGAEKQLFDALKFANDIEYDFFNRYIYKDLSKTYSKLGDYRNAIKYYELYRKEVEPISGTKAMMEAAAFQTRANVEVEQEAAEYEKRIAEMDLMEKKSHFRRMMMVSAIGFVALLVLVFFIWRILQHTRKGNADIASHNEEIKTQNEELEVEKVRLQEVNNKIRQSMRYARRIQMATVSSEAEIEELFPGALVYNKPCEIVSGDWYWTSRLGSKRILALGGSAKNGVPGALVSMMTVNALKDTIGQLSAMSMVSPSAILRTVQSKLPESARNNAAGVSLCVFGRGSVRFAGVNQNALLFKNGTPIIMGGDKPGDKFNTVSPGDAVMLYSTTTKCELVARNITPEILCETLYQKSPVEQKGAVEEFISQTEQKEDITIVSITI